MNIDITAAPSIVVDKLASELHSHGGYASEKQALAFFMAACSASSVLRECFVHTPACAVREVRGLTEVLFELAKFEVSVSLAGDETPEHLAEMLGASCGPMLDEYVRGKLPQGVTASKSVVVSLWRSVVFTPYGGTHTLRGVDARFQVKLRIAVSAWAAT